MGRSALSLFLLIIGFVLNVSHTVPQRNTGRPPIIIIPGLGGSQIEAKLNKSSSNHFICTKKSDWFTLWLNLEELAPFIIDCLAENLMLTYDNKTRKTHDHPGVTTRVPGFGNTSTIAWLDPSQNRESKYFDLIIDMLMALNYTANLDIRGAPYDFRKAPNEGSDYFKQLQSLVEETSKMNHGQKVLLMAHSMGSLYSLYFLNHMPQAWKDKHIAGLVTLSAPWVGTVKALKVFAAGDDLGTWVVSSKALKEAQVTHPSIAFLLPSDKYWHPKEVLARAPNKNYSLDNLNEFFKDIGLPNGYSMWKDTRGLLYDLKHPGVKLYCLHGVGVETIAQLKYDKQKYFPGSPTIIYGNGDGTVNQRSLEACTVWKKQKGPDVIHKTFKSLDHMGILWSPDVINLIKDIILSHSKHKV